MASSLQCLVAELLEGAGGMASANQKKRILPRHIQLVRTHDQEFEDLLKDVTITGGGTKQLIHPSLIKKKTSDK